MTSALFPTYARADVAFTRGEGAWLIAENGERYLDFASGVAVLALGHDHPHLVATLKAAVQLPPAVGANVTVKLLTPPTDTAAGSPVTLNPDEP